MRTLTALVATLLVALAGCVTPAGASQEDEAPAPAAIDLTPTANTTAGPGGAPKTGTLLVVARMPDATLLPGVNVTVGNLSASTNAEGEARFRDVAEGRTELVARKEAHRTARADVTIVAGEEVRTEVVLAPEGNDQHAHEGGIFAHRDLYVFEGHFDCSLTYVIVTGDCLVLVDNVTENAGAGKPAGEHTDERHLIDFPLDQRWAELVVELEWAPAVPTPATGDGMTLALEPAEAPADGHATKYARAVGASPLRVALVPSVQHATATADDMPNPLGGEVIRARAYVMGAAHNPGGTTFLGLGAAAQHDFNLYVSIFYEEPAPEGYSAITGGA